MPTSFVITNELKFKKNSPALHSLLNCLHPYHNIMKFPYATVIPPHYCILIPRLLLRDSPLYALLAMRVDQVTRWGNRVESIKWTPIPKKAKFVEEVQRSQTRCIFDLAARSTVIISAFSTRASEAKSARIVVCDLDTMTLASGFT